MAILVIADHDNQSLKASTLNTVAAAGKLGGDVHVLVAGAGCAGVAEAAAKVAGVAKVLVCDAAHYEAQTAENVAELVKGLAGGYSHVLAPATPAGKNMLPRVAALLDVSIRRMIDANRKAADARQSELAQEKANCELKSVNAALRESVRRAENLREQVTSEQEKRSRLIRSVSRGIRTPAMRSRYRTGSLPSAATATA